MQLVVEPDGVPRCIYSEEIDLHAFGKPAIRRASHVEPNEAGQWTADLSPVGGPTLTAFSNRSPTVFVLAAGTLIGLSIHSGEIRFKGRP
ncbi:MAG: hypothetical protein RBS80_28560 [Thermoguttaceae bacterium]|jgi:hypothetical protein|nr:hypothetical protein [Thermoguttaceae bacterium]